MATLDLSAPRAKQARLGKRIGRPGYVACAVVSIASVLGGLGLYIAGTHSGLSLAGFGLLAAMPAIWWKYGLREVALRPGTLMGRLSSDALRLLNPHTEYTPSSLWEELHRNWQSLFITNHLLLPTDQMDGCFKQDNESLQAILDQAVQLADSYHSPSVEVGHLAAALLASSPVIENMLTQRKLGRSDLLGVSAWLERILQDSRQKPVNFGGIGRDWASGFTPRLNQFGHNLSGAIERHGADFGSLVVGSGVQSMKTAFSQGTGALALIGPDGIGKTSHAYALAQNILADSTDRNLKHKQIIALEASAILSAAQRPGELEFILTSLLNEAYHAGNIMLFFDDAQLFFQTGPGSFNATQILLPLVQNRAVQCVFAMSPHDYEQLRASNMAFAGLLTPVVLREPDQAQALTILTDTASRYELQHHLLITFEALKAAYYFSGRYETDMAYPGKAINLLEQALSHADHQTVTNRSVEEAIEQTRGVKAGSAAPVEADQLLHLEERIHERMINQTRAVKVVADALRRARAGVANPNRPIGSFLFLGPTGVGKTELAKAVASTYFGDEAQMIRLDMSEYQQPTDVTRLLSDGKGESSSLILRVRQQPFSVVLLDEVEKAHPNILNLLLQLLDEGKLTDSQGRSVSFKDCVIIATSNAGADSIRQHIQAGEELEAFEQQLTDELISSGQFRPELLNRFDEIVLFRPLKPEELAQVVRLMINSINQTLATQNISVELTDQAVMKIVSVGNDPRLGARPMRRALQRAVENTVANKILKGQAQPGSHLLLDEPDLTL